MALLEIANTDRIITIISGGVWVPGIPIYTQNISTKIKVNSKGIIVGTLSWTMAFCAWSTKAFVLGNGSISPTGTKVTEKIFNMKPIRKTNFGICAMVFSYFLEFLRIAIVDLQ